MFLNKSFILFVTFIFMAMPAHADLDQAFDFLQALQNPKLSPGYIEYWLEDLGEGPHHDIQDYVRARAQNKINSYGSVDTFSFQILSNQYDSLTSQEQILDLLSRHDDFAYCLPLTNVEDSDDVDPTVCGAQLGQLFRLAFDQENLVIATLYFEGANINLYRNLEIYIADPSSDLLLTINLPITADE